MGAARATSGAFERSATVPMPFFDHPANADWLLPIIKLPLLLISSIFKIVLAVGPIGQVAIVAIAIALYTRNIMGPARP